MNTQADDERDLLLHLPERNFSVSSQVNPNNAKGYTDLSRYAFMHNSQGKDPLTSSTSLTSPYNAPLSPSHFQISSAHSLFQNPVQILRTGSRQIFHGPQLPRPDDFSFSAPIPGFGHHSPRELQYPEQPLQDTSPRDPFDFETSPYGRHEIGHAASTVMFTQMFTNFRPQPRFGSYVAEWSPSPVTQPMYSRPASSLNATSTRTRTSRTPQHRQYLDVWFYRRCPQDRIDALNMAIQCRDACPDQPIPDELVDDHLEENADGMWTFWGDKARKPRKKTGARDHVRKLLGNRPFRCPNLSCEHSALRRADLNKHRESCKFPPPPSSPPTVSWEVQNLDFPVPDLSASGSLTPQEQHTTVDTDALLGITNAGENIMDSYLTLSPLGGENEAGIDGAE